MYTTTKTEYKVHSIDKAIMIFLCILVSDFKVNKLMIFTFMKNQIGISRTFHVSTQRGFSI